MNSITIYSEEQTKNSRSNLSSFFQTKALPIIIFFMGFVAMTPLLNHLGWRGIFSLIIVISICVLYLITSNTKIKKWFIYTFIIITLGSMVTAAYWGDIRYVFANIFLIGVLFIIQFANTKAINSAIEISSFFILILLLGAIVGFIIAFVGTPPVFDFPNPDGRPNYFFYTTLSNAVFGNIIRPSGIYDEPGALSLYICAIAAIRHIHGKNNFFTWVLLLLGFITLSLAHLIYVILHIMAERINKKNIAIILSVFAIASITVVTTGFGEILNNKLIQRLAVSEATGSIEGDNRSFRMFNAIELMEKNTNIIFYGADPSCRFDYELCKELFPPIGENPLTPLFTNGLFVTWPFYFGLIFLLLTPLLGRKYLATFGFGLLLVQRPEMLLMSGAMVSSLIIYMTIMSLLNDRSSSRNS